MSLPGVGLTLVGALSEVHPPVAGLEDAEGVAGFGLIIGLGTIGCTSTF